MRNKDYPITIYLCFLMLISMTACRNSTDDDLVVGKDQDEFTVGEQVTIGEVLNTELLSQSGTNVLDTQLYAGVYDYLNTLYAMVVQTPDVLNRKDFNWQVMVLEDNENRNAFTAPGGGLYITTGMLKYLQSEHELMGVMAHELHYLDRGKVLDALKTAYGGDQLADILLGNEVADLSEMANYLSRLTYASTTVISADTFAVTTLCPFMYDARGLQSFYERAEVDLAELDIVWIDRRPGDLQERIRQVVRNATGCGTNGERFEERYQQFQQRLP